MSDTTTAPSGDADAPADPPADTAGADDSGPDRDPPDRGESEKWKSLARQHETERKKLEKELEKVRRSQMSEHEKAVAEAEERGRQAATADFATERAAARIEVALTGVVPDPASIVEDLNLARYVTNDGQVDAKAVKALVDKFAALSPSKEEPPPRRVTDFGQGRRQGTPQPSVASGAELWRARHSK